MKRSESQSLHLKQMEAQLLPFRALGAVPRPVGGWIRAVRQALGLSLKAVAEPMKVSPQEIHRIEKAESIGSVSLRLIEATADAMGCRVVYAIVPKNGTLTDLSKESGGHAIRASLHSMALEGQGVEKPI